MMKVHAGVQKCVVEYVYIIIFMTRLFILQATNATWAHAWRPGKAV